MYVLNTAAPRRDSSSKVGVKDLTRVKTRDYRVEATNNHLRRAGVCESFVLKTWSRRVKVDEVVHRILLQEAVGGRI